jgi:hypothetical protein
VSARPAHHTSYFELVEALATGGCPICGLVERSGRHQLSSLAYDQVNDPQVRDHLRRARGFCRRHAWQFLGMGDTVFGTAIIYADLLRALERVLPSWDGDEKPEREPGLLRTLFGLGRHGHQPAPCPTCTIEQEAEDRYLGTLLELLADAGVRARYGSGGWIVPRPFGAGARPFRRLHQDLLKGRDEAEA